MERTPSASQRGIDAQRQLQIFEDSAAPRLQDERAPTILANDARVVTDQNHRLVGPLDEERLMAFAMEPLVADRQHLVDQKAFEINRQRQRKHEAGPHPRRISIDGNMQLPAELGEIVDESENVPLVAIVEAGDEARAGGAGHIP